MSDINFKLFPANSEEIPDDFIHFHYLKTSVVSCYSIPEEQIYLRLNEQSDRKVQIVYYLPKDEFEQKNPDQKKDKKKKGAKGGQNVTQTVSQSVSQTVSQDQNEQKKKSPTRKSQESKKEIHVIASYYTKFTYTKGLYQLLKENDATNYRLVLSTENLTDEHKFYLNINFYIRRTYLDQLYEMKKLPSLIWQVLQTESLDEKGRWKYKTSSCNERELVPVALTPVTTIWDDGDEIEEMDKSGFFRPPYPYQMSNIRWMCDLENKIQSGLGTYETFIGNLIDHGPNYVAEQLAQQQQAQQQANQNNSYYQPPTSTPSRYEISQQMQVRFDVPSIDSYLICDKEGGLVRISDLPQAKVQLRGGVLADQIGLGKTLSMIGLVYRQKLSLPVDELGDGGQNKQKTLVFCPRRLCKQWQEEINKTAPLKSYIVSTIVQMRKLTRKKLAEIDIVICPYSMLTNENYVKHCEALKELVDTGELDEQAENAKINLQEYQWHRVILDEGHEYLHPSRKKPIVMAAEALRAIKSDYRWVCSGTPFADWEGLWDIFRYVCRVEFQELELQAIARKGGAQVLPVNSYYNNHYYQYLITFKEELTLTHFFHLYDTLMRDLFQYNTHETVANQVMIPPPMIATEFLEQTAIERNIYESALGDEAKMFELCNHIMVSEDHVNILGNKPLPLSEIHQKMTTYYHRKVTRLEKRIENLGEKIEERETRGETGGEMGNQGDTEGLDELDLEMKLEELEDLLQDTQAKLHIFESLDERFKEFTSCPICWEPMDRSNLKVITSCGHFFCSECITHIFENETVKAKCPMCRQGMQKDEIEVVQDEQETSENDKSDQEDNELDLEAEQAKNIDRWGTKMARMICYLKEILAEKKTNRAIVFSQWDTLLRFVHNILDEVGIPHLILNGSVYQVNSKIRKFKLDPNLRVVLLSSEKAASGLTLTEASHIILVDTLNTAAESAQLLEEQAIGRAVRIGQKETVQVKRLVMQDTIEEEYFLKYRGAKQVSAY